MGGSAVVGSLIVGFLCSRLGAALTLALIAATQVAGWLVLLSTSAFPLMAATALFLGIGGAGVFPAINVLSGRLFGLASLPRVIGLFGLVTLPFTFGMPPLMGVLRDLTQNYSAVVMVIVASSAAAGIMFVAMARIAARRPPEIVAAT
jgi:MFS family permease